MATSDYDNAVKYNVTISQKEHCASIAMRGTVETLVDLYLKLTQF